VSSSVLVGLALVATAPVRVAGAPKAKAAKPSGAACAAKCEATTGPATIMGPVKSALAGKTFVVSPKGGDVTVDASKATVLRSGKKVALSAVKPGAVVKVKGVLKNRKLKASEVCICDAPAGGGTPGAEGGGSRSLDIPGRGAPKARRHGTSGGS